MLRDPRRYDARKASLSTYMYGMARHMTRRRLRRERRFLTFSDANHDRPALCASIVTRSPFDDVLKRHAIQEVRRAVVRLPARYREVVVLCDLHGLSYADAAAIVNCAIGTVRSRLHRGRHLLSDKLRRLSGSVRGESVHCARGATYEY